MHTRSKSIGAVGANADFSLFEEDGAQLLGDVRMILPRVILLLTKLTVKGRCRCQMLRPDAADVVPLPMLLHPWLLH